eukprot:7065849-Alexandrium_andersonii.AAC.1
MHLEQDCVRPGLPLIPDPDPSHRGVLSYRIAPALVRGRASEYGDSPLPRCKAHTHASRPAESTRA